MQYSLVAVKAGISSSFGVRMRKNSFYRFDPHFEVQKTRCIIYDPPNLS